MSRRYTHRALVSWVMLLIAHYALAILIPTSNAARHTADLDEQRALARGARASFLVHRAWVFAGEDVRCAGVHRDPVASGRLVPGVTSDRIVSETDGRRTLSPERRPAARAYVPEL